MDTIDTITGIDIDTVGILVRVSSLPPCLPALAPPPGIISCAVLIRRDKDALCPPQLREVRGRRQLHAPLHILLLNLRTDRQAGVNERNAQPDTQEGVTLTSVAWVAVRCGLCSEHAHLILDAHGRWLDRVRAWQRPP